MHSQVDIRIAASPALVFRLARDVERWADLLPHYTRSAAVERLPDGSVVAEFVAWRPLLPVLGLGLPVTWRSRTWSEPATCRLRFVHVAGATKGMDVTWRIEPDGDGAHVVIEHVFAPRLPGLALVVDRFFTHPIAGRTLATFKAIAEAVESAAVESAAAESGTASPANPSP